MKIMRFFSLIVIVLTFLSIFGFASIKINDSKNMIGPLTKPFKNFVNFPEKVDAVWEELFPKTDALSVKPRKSFELKNNLDNDLFSVHSNYDTKSRQWIITLKNLKEDSVIHTWQLDESNHFYTDRSFARSRPFCPILLEDLNLVVSCMKSNNLYRLNRDSEVVWQNSDVEYHHSIELDSENNIWACGYEQKKHKFPDLKGSLEFTDDLLMKINLETGETIESINVSDIFLDNNQSTMLYGFGRNPHNIGADPIHLNDIQPALTSSENYLEGDLFLSMRNRSMIIQYRPSTNKAIRILQGPFLYQHDVDILDDDRISIFNNNVFEMSNNEQRIERSNVLIYNMADSTYSEPIKDVFVEEKIYTQDQGLHEFLSNGDLFVESQNKAEWYLIRGNQVILRAHPSAKSEGKVDLPNWVRIYEKINKYL